MSTIAQENAAARARAGVRTVYSRRARSSQELVSLHRPRLVRRLQRYRARRRTCTANPPDGYQISR